ncbi:serine hydrolase domain-containing protein [Tenggerimyces flavus]|uniref:Serine hydrolase domain-containing protein n=1 Tax=Tenggerimyces flavus TaxID=1708749 RepID=A0ABV7Y656_9ACTN|nr:serine hydrolase domain-containing protein [Tenggerimyces flavus]MBM7785195.1 D-alanyl-D-alanine carboxypeptidase [Tenggerimyces flavus]
MYAWLRHARILLLVLTLGVVGAATYATPAAAKTAPALEKVVAAGFPGAVAVDRVGRDVEISAAGVADVRTGRKAKAGDRFRIGSVTKPMVSTVVLQLVAERQVSLDARVAKLLPGVGLDERITVRHLLQQTSGFHTDTYVFQPPRSIDANRYRHFTPRELVKIALTNPAPRATPGTKWEYSNTNYVLAGMVVERVTGNRVERELERRIFRPLRLKDTSFPRASTFIHGRHLRGYLQDETGKATLDYTDYNMSWAWSAGAVVSTVADETAFLRGLFTGKLLPKSLLAKMMDDGKFGYGLGLYAMPAPCVPGGLVWGHNGQVFGYQSAVFSTPDGKRQIAVGANAWILNEEGGGLHPIVDQTAAGSFCPNSGQSSRMMSKLLAR